MQGLHADIVECNTAYPKARTNDKDHLELAREHGFTDIAPFHLLDNVSSTALPVVNGRHINYALIGKDWLNYNFTIVLSHFKGHPMAGFDGALKNMGIGMLSREGNAWLPKNLYPPNLFVEKCVLNKNRTLFHTFRAMAPT